MHTTGTPNGRLALLILALATAGCAGRSVPVASYGPPPPVAEPTPTRGEELELILGDEWTAQEAADLRTLQLARYEPPADARPPDLDAGLKELLEEEGAVLIDEEVGYDIPIVLNDRVEWWIDYFTRRIRGSFSRYLTRAATWLPYLQNELREAGLPEDLAYLVLIESGFSQQAVSRAGAVGPWQFMSYTGREYGLRIDRWVDERRDYERATQAAVAYLSDLHAMFGSWYLAAAGYNGGQGRVGRSMLRDNTINFWELTGLHDETKNYVPKLIAATIIAKQPVKYGFGPMPRREPIEWAKVTVPTSTDLDVIAELAEVPVDVVQVLNAHLVRGRTPPGEENFPVKIPADRVERFNRNVVALAPSERIRAPLVHPARAGESVVGIANAYGVDAAELARENGLSPTAVLAGGERIVIPGRSSAATVDVDARTGGDVEPEPQARPAPPPARVHRVQRGETLLAIARRYDVTLADLRRANGIRGDRILPGQRLRIP